MTEIRYLCNGDEVYFKRNGEQRWHGPGTVIGRDGKQVLVCHGGVYIRAHICRLAKLPLEPQIGDPQTCGESLVGTQRASRNMEADCDQEEGDSEPEEVVSSAPAGRALPEDSAEELRDSGEERELLQGQNDIASGTDFAGNF